MAEKHCPTCTCGVPLLDADALLAILTHGVPHREVYRGRSSNQWFVTHGGGETHPDTVAALIADEKIHSVYDSCPNDAYHVGKTLDTKASQLANAGRKKKDPRIEVYTDGTREHR